MIKILVTGSEGQLGSELKALQSNYNFEFLFTDVEDFDITKKNSFKEKLQERNFDYIINCAAYTAVDKAEEEIELVNKINHIAVENLAEICTENNIKLIHISTDYVFDGTSSTPYVETDNTNPISIYGKSKLKGEGTILNKEGLDAIIIRTAWLYSSFGANFVKSISKYAKEREELEIVFDQVGSPTYAGDLAKSILDIIEFSETNNRFKKGIYHYSNEGVCSWYDFTKEIVKMSKITCTILPIRSSEYPTLATRPSYSVFDKTKIKQTFNIQVPFWKDSLKKCLNILQENS